MSGFPNRNVSDMDAWSRAMTFIPEQLTLYKQWVGVRDETPLTPIPLTVATTYDPETWGDYCHALSALGDGSVDGLGFVLAKNDPFVAIKLDSCRNPETREIVPWAREVLGLFDDTYVEPSGCGYGLHILTEGKLRGANYLRRTILEAEATDENRTPEILITQASHLIWLTGDILGRGFIRYKQKSIRSLARKFFPERKNGKKNSAAKTQ